MRAWTMRDRRKPVITLRLASRTDIQSWLGKFGQRDKWSFCLTAARMAAEQEKR
jgi:hypothetical protein